MKRPRSPLLRNLTALTLAISVAITTTHAEKPKAGPSGGKLVGTAPDQAEFLISSDGLVTITFLDAEQRPVPPGARTASVFAQLDSGKKQIELDRHGEHLVSREPLPQPEGYMLILQTRSSPEDKPANTRIKYQMHTCGGCDRREYACTCEDH